MRLDCRSIIHNNPYQQCCLNSPQHLFSRDKSIATDTGAVPHAAHVLKGDLALLPIGRTATTALPLTTISTNNFACAKVISPTAGFQVNIKTSINIVILLSQWRVLILSSQLYTENNYYINCISKVLRNARTSKYIQL